MDKITCRWTGILFLIAGYCQIWAATNCMDLGTTASKYFDSYEILENSSNIPVIRIFYKTSKTKDGSNRYQLGTDIGIDGSKFVELIMAKLTTMRTDMDVQYDTLDGYETYRFGTKIWNYINVEWFDNYKFYNLGGVGIGRKGDSTRIEVHLTARIDNDCIAFFNYDLNDTNKQIQFDYMFAGLIEYRAVHPNVLSPRSISWKKDGGGKIVGIVLGEWSDNYTPPFNP